MTKTLSHAALLALVFLLLPSSAWCKDIKLDIRPGVGVTQQAKMSDYFAPLEGTNLDTDIYILDSGIPGATGLLIGGTHGNELAGTVTGLVTVENDVPTLNAEPRTFEPHAYIFVINFGPCFALIQNKIDIIFISL